MAIAPLPALPLVPAGQTPLPTPASSDAASSSTFSSSLKDVISGLDGSASDANDAVGKMLDGTGDVHEAMIALQKADLMLQLTVQVRNKLVQAYQDVMRMPI